MHTYMRGFTRRLVLLLLFASCAWSQAYPSKPIKIIVPLPPGGGNDVFARVIGEKLRERLGQPVVVENRPGASTIIGANFVAKSAPDGHTLLVWPPGVGLVPLTHKSLPFDVIRDFSPIGIGATQPLLVAVTNRLPVKSINELISYARENPGKLSCGVPGLGSYQHLVVERFKNMTSTKIVVVSYKGATDVLANLMSGELHLMFGALNSAVPLIRSGKIRPIAIAEHQRLPEFPDIPTVDESVHGFFERLFFGLAAPAGTPEPIVSKLSGELRTIVNMPDVRRELAAVGMVSDPSSAAEMHQLIADELAKWANVLKAAGITLQ